MSMRPITFLQPNRLTFGAGCLAEAVTYLAALPSKRIHIVHSFSLASIADEMQRNLIAAGCTATTDRAPAGEPTIAAFNFALARARGIDPTCIVGIGGGSALDLAKLLAAFLRNDQRVEDTFGIGLLASRNCHLVCIPSTSGTGSEVSPNAILLDESAQLKKGVISPHLVPDAAFIDPTLTHSVPPAVTAYTGLDALTHLIEAYTNRFAHPLVDLYALEGIALCARFLPRAVRSPNDAEAREGMSRASLYGGLCLGPVNTAAVHALAYPLGGELHLPNELSNAVLLPAVFRFNAEASPERHADVAHALGAAPQTTALATAFAGATVLEQLTSDCGIDINLAHHGIDRSTIPQLAAAALTVQRLLRNNPRDITQPDAESIYAQCFTN